MPKQNDTSNVKQQLEIIALRKEVERLLIENSNLKQELKSKPEVMTTSQTEIESDLSSEEDIALRELRKLQNKSKSGLELTLEEVKKYDILVKNKRLSQSDPGKDEKDPLIENSDDNNLLILANAKLEKK